LRVFPDEPGVEGGEEKGPRQLPQVMDAEPEQRRDLPRAPQGLIETVGLSPESRRAEELLGRLDDLSDDEVEQLLRQQMAAQETDVEP